MGKVLSNEICDAIKIDGSFLFDVLSLVKELP